MAANGAAIADAERYDYAGYRLSQWHRNAEAIVYYSAAITANPSDFTARFNRGCVYLEEHDYAKAVADFDAALRLNPKKAGEIYGVRAIGLFGLGRDAECRADLDRAMPRSQTTRPSISELRRWLCESSLHPSPNEVKRAVAMLDRAVSTSQTTDQKVHALNGRAWFYAVCRASSARDVSQAIADAAEACRLSDFSDPAILDTLATAYARHGNFEKAIETEKKALAKIFRNRNSKPEYQRRLAAFQQHRCYYLTLADRL